VRDLFGQEVAPRPPGPRKGGRPSRAYLVALRIERGQHPHQGDEIGPAGEACGSCKHCDRYRNYGGGKTWAKCALTPGGHVATDIKVRWPACVKWEARP
jgi:hypothetical protein